MNSVIMARATADTEKASHCSVAPSTQQKQTLWREIMSSNGEEEAVDKLASMAVSLTDQRTRRPSQPRAGIQPILNVYPMAASALWSSLYSVRQGGHGGRVRAVSGAGLGVKV